MFVPFFLIVASSILISSASLSLKAPLVDYVNILGGSDSKYDMSHGSTLPMVTRPWGASAWVPQTNLEDQKWWFKPYEYIFYGMRCTHQPSPWINDYGQFLLQATLPYTGSDSSSTSKTFASGYDPRKSTFSPTTFETNLMAFGNTNEMTAVIDGVNEATTQDHTRRLSVKELLGTTFITGYSVANSDSQWAYVDVESSIDTVTLRVGTSLISADQALLNMQNQAGLHKSLEEMIEDSAEEWQQQLSKMELLSVGDAYDESQAKGMLEMFYTAQYRASIFPRQLSEIDADGKEVHWSPYSEDEEGRIYEGPISTDSGFWDAYTTIYPLHSLVNLDVLGPTIMTGWLNAYKEGGWMPKWASPGYRDGMVSTMADVSFASAIVNEIPGLDKHLAYEAIRKDAFTAPPDDNNGIGRVCLDAYIKYGYIPNDSPMTTGGTCYEVVSRTLNYQMSDYSISKAAEKLGKMNDHNILAKRASNFSSIFDSSTGFFRSKDENGKYRKSFDQYDWGGDYTEAGPWQYRFYVPWDAQGLKKAYADANLDLCVELENAMTMKSLFHIANYGTEIHEQTEMVTNCFGQYEHNNQPVHYMLWIQVGHKYLRKTLQELYKPGLDMYTGDEDNGQMSAWYLLGSIGLYELAPGSGNYVLGSPLFESVKLRISKNKFLYITASNQGPANVYVHEITMNGKIVTAGHIPYKELITGGILHFKMSDKPTTNHF
eukprot:GSChrysophyteH1.ASY1.ANO1.228.1 assembled CDS